jgi:predicted amidophosphoribosyltransferase
MTTACNYKRLQQSYNGRYRSEGLFNTGWALGNHTNFHCQTNSFERSAIGGLVHSMKYGNSLDALHEVAQMMAEFITRRLERIGAGPEYFAAIVPVPPTVDRLYQPVIELARTVATLVGIPCDTGLLIKVGKHQQMKTIQGYDSKRAILNDAMSITHQRYAGKRVLLIDDIIDSGATLDTSADFLKRHGGVATVNVLCATYTFTQQ